MDVISNVNRLKLVCHKFVYIKKYIFINTEAGIGEARDLEGKRIGVQEYRQTAGVWVRGILQHEYGVDLNTVRWFEGGVNTPRKPDKVMDLRPIPEIPLELIAHNRCLNDMLEAGEIDAYFGARRPKALEAGEGVALFNGRDGEWRSTIGAIGRGGCLLEVVEQTRAQESDPDLWLVFSPIKRAGVDFVAAKATELGVAAIWPVMTRYTAVTGINTERLRTNAIEAAEQCGRVTVPEVMVPIPLERAPETWPVERRILLCDGRRCADAREGERSGHARPVGGADRT